VDRNLEIAKLVYEEAIRAISEQERSLDSIRGRAATNIAVVSISTSLLGYDVLLATLKSTTSTIVIVIIAILFSISVVTSVWILRSKRDWVFNQSPKHIIRDYIENNQELSLTDVKLYLAGYLEDNIDSNERRLRELLNWLNLAFTATVLQILAAVLALGLSVWRNSS
jgi:hypothetical protein